MPWNWESLELDSSPLPTQSSRSPRQRSWIPVLLLLLCLASYGLTVRSLGFYWDDWPGLYVTRYLGHQDVKDYLSSDRPATAALFSLTAPLLGSDPRKAHLFALILRWAVAVAAWWTLLGIWPERRLEAAAIGCLVAVYPGFSLHSIAWIHSQGVYVPLLLSFFSFGAMVWSVRAGSGGWPLAVAGVLTAASGMLLVEYFIGLEFLRPLVVWSAFETKDRRQRIRRAFLVSLPYLAATVLIAGSRLLLFHSSRAATDQSLLAHSLLAQPGAQIFQRVHHLVTDIVQAGLMTWTGTFSSSLFTSESSMAWVICLLVLAGVTCLTALWLAYLRTLETQPDISQSSWPRYAVVGGLLAMLFGGLPVWAANRHIVLGELSDRYSLPLMLGACLFAVGLIRMSVRTSRQQIFLLALLTGLGAAYQYRTGQKYARDWTLQKDLMWQLSWRAPGLKNGTAILIDDESALSPKSDYALSVPLNLTYSNDPRSPRLSYWFFELGKAMQPNVKAALSSGSLLKGEARSLQFYGTPSEALVVSYAPPGCLVVLDPGSANGPGVVGSQLRSFSHPDRILTSPSVAARPLPEIFGPEPSHSWCYYFERGGLAAQAGDWARVVQLGDEARTRGLAPAVPLEWLPFVEGYLRAGRRDTARELKEKIRTSLALGPDFLEAEFR